MKTHLSLQLNLEQLLFKALTCTIEAIGPKGDNCEVKETFLFHTDERISRPFNLFYLFIFMGCVRFYGIDVVVGTASKLGGIDHPVHCLEHLYVEKRAKSLLGTSDFFLPRIDCHLCLFLKLKATTPGRGFLFLSEDLVFDLPCDILDEQTSIGTFIQAIRTKDARFQTSIGSIRTSVLLYRTFPSNSDKRFTLLDKGRAFPDTESTLAVKIQALF